jgi:small subunit ribosomal protein S20
MPNTKSAERRVRNSARKNLQNRSVKSKLRRLEKDFRAAVTAGKKDDAAKLLSGVHSAFDKAVKVGAIPRPTANRKKSRLAVSLK